MPHQQDLSALETLHGQIQDRVTGAARRLLSEHVPYHTMRDPEDQPETPDIACNECTNWQATEDPSTPIAAAWPCLPVRAVAELAGITIAAELAQ